MKRIALHILFWAAYLTQDTLLAFLWDGSSLSHLPVINRIFIAIELCAALLPPKILFTYFILYVILNRILKQNTRLNLTIIYLAIALISALLLIRVINIYFVFPIVYSGLKETPSFFDPTAFLFELIDLGFVSGLAIFIRQLGLQLAGKEKEKMLIKEKLEAELKFLKNQTNPHFLFNTLNNIYALARKKSDKTADVVMKLSKILRFVLYESGKEFITIKEELKIIEDYIDLERIRYDERLDVTLKKEIDNDNQKVSPLLLLPFVENAFKHGVSETRFDSFIKIDIKLQQGSLEFVIENTKDEEINTGEENDRIGLYNIRRQLELVYGEFDLQVDNGAKFFKVTLSLNLNKHGKI